MQGETEIVQAILIILMLLSSLSPFVQAIQLNSFFITGFYGYSGGK
jgi:hypothetical protein